MDSDSSNDGSDSSNKFYDRPGPDWEYVTQVSGEMYDAEAQKEVRSFALFLSDAIFIPLLLCLAVW